MLTDDQLRALMVHANSLVEDCASDAVSGLLPGGKAPDPVYPPNGGYTAEERDALVGLASTAELTSGLRKLIADAIAAAMFRHFNVIDGTGDPDGIEGWMPVELTLRNEDGEDQDMLHDAFMDAYWDWREQRPDPGWKLDLWAD